MTGGVVITITQLLNYINECLMFVLHIAVCKIVGGLSHDIIFDSALIDLQTRYLAHFSFK